MFTKHRPRIARIEPNLKQVTEFKDAVKKKHLKDIGTVFAERRRKLGLTQYELAQRLWPKEELSKTAAQTRVYRIESGQQELTYQETHRLFDILKITDYDTRTLKPLMAPDQHGLLIDIRALELYPDLAAYIELINKNLKRNDLAHLKEVFKTMCRYLANTPPEANPRESKRHLEQAAGEHPFSKGVAEK